MVNKAASICLSASMVTASLFMVMSALVQEPHAGQTATAVQLRLPEDLNFSKLQFSSSTVVPPHVANSLTASTTPHAPLRDPQQARTAAGQPPRHAVSTALPITYAANPAPVSVTFTQLPDRTTASNTLPAAAFAQHDRATISQAASRYELALAAPAPQLPASVLSKEPLLVKQVSARYPQQALSRNITGFVEVRIAVDAHGRVTHTEVVRAVPEGYFEEATLKAVQRFQFQPAEVAGVAQPASDILYRMTFGPQRT